MEEPHIFDLCGHSQAGILRGSSQGGIMRIRLAVIAYLIGIALAAPDARAQGVLWAERMGGAGFDDGWGIAVD